MPCQIGLVTPPVVRQISADQQEVARLKVLNIVVNKLSATTLLNIQQLNFGVIVPAIIEMQVHRLSDTEGILHWLGIVRIPATKAAKCHDYLHKVFRTGTDNSVPYEQQPTDNSDRTGSKSGGKRPLPDIRIPKAQTDLIAAFSQRVSSIGGQVVQVMVLSDITDYLRLRFMLSGPTVTNIQGLSTGDYLSAHTVTGLSLETVELAVLQGVFGVAENEAIWLDDRFKPGALTMDATERLVARSTAQDAQLEEYSGKAKDHTCKNQLLCDDAADVHFLSLTYEGKVHDKALADAEALALPAGQLLRQDTGYHPPGVLVSQPLKKPRGKELTDQQKVANQAISCQRVIVEPLRRTDAINGIKRLHCLSGRLRLKGWSIRDVLMRVGTALHNLRVNSPCRSYKPLTPTWALCSQI